MLPSSGGDGGQNSSGSTDQSFHERKILPYVEMHLNVPFSYSTLNVTQAITRRYSQKQLYDLVADVDSYRQFVPYCTASRVLNSRILRPNDAAGRPPIERKEAELTVGFMAFKESYVSQGPGDVHAVFVCGGAL